MAEQTNTADVGLNSAFLEKVGEIPAVSAAKEYGTAAYNHVKQMHSLTNYTLSKAESTLLYFALSAKPFLDKVQPQAKIVDDMACRTLEVVEEKVPFIKKTPEELVDEARKLCISTVGTGIQKVEEIKTMSSEALSNIKNYGVQKANDCLSGTENLVDRYLPPAFGEGSKASAPIESETIRDKAARLTRKMSDRIYDHGVKQFILMQEMSQESIAKLAYTVELMQYVKDNTNKSVQNYVDDAKVKATWIWDELNKEPSDAQDAEKSLEQRLLLLARRLTSTLVHTYASTTSTAIANLPQKCHDGVQAATSYAADLFTQFDQAANVGEVASTILHRVRGTISALETIVKSMVDTAKEKENIEMEDLSKKDETPPSES